MLDLPTDILNLHLVSHVLQLLSQWLGEVLFRDVEELVNGVEVVQRLTTSEIKVEESSTGTGGEHQICLSRILGYQTLIVDDGQFGNIGAILIH